MTPQDKKKFQDAWRKALKRIQMWINLSKALICSDGRPRRRALMEFALASEQVYEAIDQMLKQFPTVTLDQIIKTNFDAPTPKKPGPKP